MAKRLVSLGRSALKNYPVITNTTVYATFYTAAELSQQTFNKYYTPEKPDYDFRSAARVIVVGSCVYAPSLYYWYRILDRKFVGNSMKAVACKVFGDQGISTPILMATFYTVISVLERREDIFKELREKFWKTFWANQAFWIPAQTINFYFLPANLRVVFVASGSFLWINVLCFIKRQKVETKVLEEK